MIGRRGFLGGLLACFGLSKLAPDMRASMQNSNTDERLNWNACGPPPEVSVIECDKLPGGPSHRRVWFPDGDSLTVFLPVEGPYLRVTTAKGRRLVLKKRTEDIFTIIAAECA